jgi:hypothetical protein
MSGHHPRRSILRLAPVLLLAVGWPWSRAVAREGWQRVVVLEPAAASTDIHRCMTRIREELAAGGFEVEVVDPGLRHDPVSIAAAMEDQTDATAVMALIGDPSSTSAELWVLDRVGERAEVHRIPLSTGDPEHVPEILAIRTIEVLRASALKRLVESSRAAVAARAPPLPASVSDRLSVPASHTFGIETGIAVVESIGGLGAAAIPVIRLRAELTGTIFLRLGVAALGSRPTVETSIGSATISQAFGLIEGGIEFRPGRRLQPQISLGAGGLRVDEVGRGVSPVQGQAGGRWAGLVDGGAGLSAGLAPGLALVAEVHAFVAFPYPTIRFVDTTVSSVGRPALVQLLTLVAWL